MHEDQPSEEIDIRLDDAPGELVGEYASVDDYLRSVLEEFIHADALWLLDCLDMPQVRQRFEAGGHRYACEHGRVYRRSVGR